MVGEVTISKADYELLLKDRIVLGLIANVAFKTAGLNYRGDDLHLNDDAIKNILKYTHSFEYQEAFARLKRKEEANEQKSEG